MSGRGMKKWAPYKSLIEQAPSIERMQKEKQKVEKPILSEDKIQDINERLVNYNGEEVTISYYENGFIKYINSIIKQIDINNQCLILEDKIISFQNLLDIE